MNIFREQKKKSQITEYTDMALLEILLPLFSTSYAKQAKINIHEKKCVSLSFTSSNR